MAQQSVARPFHEADFDDDARLHLHEARLYRSLDVPVISVPSATQRAAANGFYVLRIRGQDDIRAEHHVWRRTAFVQDPTEALSAPL
jgi:hypothetical protein